MDREIQDVRDSKRFELCPLCGYRDGFHSVFRRIEGTREAHWYLVCPSCHAAFDWGLRASTA